MSFQIHLYFNTYSGSNMDQKWVVIFLFYIAPILRQMGLELKTSLLYML
jgi:hypothetical protein